MNIAQAIMHLYPQANPMMDFIVQDDSDGNGAYIAAWNIDAPQPTEEELQAAWKALQDYKEVESLDTKKADRLKELDETCAKSINGIFISSATGDPHQYSFDLEAQINLQSVKDMFAMNPAFIQVKWNTRDAGVLIHNKDQFMRLWIDGMMHKNSQLDKLRILEAQVSAAVSVSEVEQIKWV